MLATSAGTAPMPVRLVGQIGLLRLLFDRGIIPQDVHRELLCGQVELPELIEAPYQRTTMRPGIFGKLRSSRVATE